MQLSDAEWIVMNAIWEAGLTEAVDVIEAVAPDNQWTDATVKTMLHRLVKKKALVAEKIGKKYRYSPAVRRSDCVRRASRSFLARVFGGDVIPALLHLVATSKLTDAELAQLRDLLDSKGSRKKGPRK
ncbi:MAG: BlaI/MecI/CopY family transcriptional regulator [Planctomycetota bacterium]|nr:BlaI/MecI/CopY family transcriptional regulator [Planctomycetota bacterium]